ncbi:hypothetical protein B0O99DRAFT_687700 [Bisporella sp. PMI_857]|nr:hypothetical protein B0O99DRAFT_687700 [Bisporella sp. PMI_857]
MTVNLWQEAASTLDQKLQVQLAKLGKSGGGPDGLLRIVQEKREECIAKQWTCRNFKGQRVYVKEIFEKVALWLDKVKGVGDIVSSFDPVHAALPWAGARFLITLATSDIKHHGAMMESVEVIIDVMSRYALIEQIYCQRYVTEAEKKVRSSIVAVYSAILSFLYKVFEYFGFNTAKRMVMSLAHLGADSDVLTHEVKERDKELQKWTPLVDKEIQNDANAQIGIISNGIDKLRVLLQDLERPLAFVKTTLEKIQDGLEQKERMRILRWLSTELYISHHKTISSNRLAGSGSWMLNKDAYRKWKYSSRHPFLWLNGAPGSGKSVLTSLVVDDISEELSQKTGRPPIAYFYCSRESSEPRRADSTEILLSILKQLTCDSLDDPISPWVAEKWQERRKLDSDDRLDRTEAVEIIIEICNMRGGFIIIDALDECPRNAREELMDSLDTICQNSTSLVRFFVSSRPNADIRQHFNKTPKLEILARRNSGDIVNYVNSELDKKIKAGKFLAGHPSEGLVKEVKAVLTEQADGIFRWVAASIQTLCALDYEIDVRDALGRLPSDLNDVYAIIMTQINEGRTVTKTLAKKALHWLLCAQQPLCTKEFIYVLSCNGPDLVLEDNTITKEYILDMCCNLVKYDAELDVIRFIHLSVREYLESKHPEFEQAKCNETAALTCLRNCLTGKKPRRKALLQQNESKTFYDYSMVYWPLHCAEAREYRRQGTLSRTLMTFLYQDKMASETFRTFLSSWRESWSSLELDLIASADSGQALELRLSECESRHPNPIFLACAFGFTEILQDERKFKERDAERVNRRSRSPFEIAVSQGQQEVVDLFISKRHGGSEESDEAALIVAASMNREDMVIKLLDNNQKLEISDQVFQWAVNKSSISVVRYLLSHERCAEIVITNFLVRSAAQNVVNGDEIVEELLTRDPALNIEDATIRSACHNPTFGPKIVRALLERRPDFVATEVAFEYAAGNHKTGLELLKLLLSKTKDGKLTVNEYMLENAAGIHSMDPMRFLLNHDPDARPNIQCLFNACYNYQVADKMLPLLLNRCDSWLINSRLLREAMRNRRYGLQLTDLVLAKADPDQLLITNDVLIEAAENRVGEMLLEKLLPRFSGKSIHSSIAVIAAGHQYSPVEILTQLHQYDPSLKFTENVCMRAVRNPQYAIEIIEYLQQYCEPLLKSPKVLEQVVYNQNYGHELVQRFWDVSTAKLPDVSERAVEVAVYNKKGDRILAHWMNARCKIPVTQKAVENVMYSTIPLEVFRILLRIDKRLYISPKAICLAAEHSAKGPSLLKAIARQLPRPRRIANDELIFSAVSNFESGNEVIEILFDQFTFSITPSLLECMCASPYEQSTWSPILNVAPPSCITVDAADYAMGAQEKIIPVLNALLSKRPDLELSSVAWGDLLRSQSQNNAKSLSATLELLAKHKKIPIISERTLTTLIRHGQAASKAYAILQDYAHKSQQELSITAEHIHACLKTWSNTEDSLLELLFETLALDSKVIEISQYLYEDLFLSNDVEDLVVLFEKYGYMIPTGPKSLRYIQHAILNNKLTDDTLEHLFQITPEERRILCGQEENLIVLSETDWSWMKLRRILTNVQRPLPITTRILIAGIKKGRGAVYWLRTAAAQDTEAFPALITEELVIEAASKGWPLIELSHLSVQMKFNLPISSKAVANSMRLGLYYFRIMVHYIIRQGGVDLLLSLLTKDCLIELSANWSATQVVNEILALYLEEEKLRDMYSEPMLMRAAGCSQVHFLQQIYDHIPNAKPLEYYLQITQLQHAISEKNLVRARKLLDAGVDPNTKNIAYRTFLASACSDSDLCIVRLALEYSNVDINMRDDQGKTPLIIAAERGNYDIVQKLLQKGAERHHQELEYYKTAEEMAMWHGHYSIAELIAKYQVQ